MAKTDEAMKEKLVKLSEISLSLDTYDDIFSDFDSRQYSERALSDDLISEMKRAIRDKPSGDVVLNFIMPMDMRNSEDEQLIKKRLKEHFKRHHNFLHKEINLNRTKGIGIVGLGVLLMLAATYVYKFISLHIALMTLFLFLEPAGWFTVWTGLEKIMNPSGTKNAEFEFYEKLSKVEINFLSY
ncbi:MAG: hypothetical protein PHC66_00305 [Candidatus Nanoarchaeia archaeon]|nr:hypothetical protein [Candidatus Nanoarchaeia archaeon]MDD5239609.1 hypothetical protein [Candidatus Nanoarchaeia archaeon]